MYDKITPNTDDSTEEVVIKLESENLAKSLYYRDEGNMNIVVSLFANENDEKRVIRFKKIPAGDKTKSNDSQHRNELTSFVRFEELLLKYFKNSELFTVVPKIVFLDGNVDALNKFLMRDRPAARQSKVIGSRFGLLYRDVAFLPKSIYMKRNVNGELKDASTVCIEIKAKQGYLMDEEDDVFGVRKCRFCYFQYLKLRNKRIHSISSYCPIDLFSGKAERMNRAIDGLLLNPQNNLKMFLDGKIIYNEYSKDKSSFRRALTSLFPEASTEKQKTLFVNLIRKVLLKDFKDCDSIADVCVAYEAEDNIHERSCVADDQQLPANCILNSILNAQMLVKNNFPTMEAYIEGEPANETILQNYKIGSTALDCSIMITIKKINGNVEARKSLIHENHQLTMKGTSHLFAVNATIVDLDLKKDSIAHFRKYKTQHSDSRHAYLDFVESNRTKA